MGLERGLPRNFHDDVGAEIEKIVQGVDNRNVMTIAAGAGSPDQGADTSQFRHPMEQSDDR